MKKNILPARTETKPGKTLFGVPADKLKAVNGGSGVIGHQDGPSTPPANGG